MGGMGFFERLIDHRIARLKKRHRESTFRDAIGNLLPLVVGWRRQLEDITQTMEAGQAELALEDMEALCSHVREVENGMVLMLDVFDENRPLKDLIEESERLERENDDEEMRRESEG